MGAEIQQFYLALGQGLILLVAGWIGISIRGVYRELRTQNGRLRTMEERMQGHIDLDNVRFDDLRDLIKEIITSLRDARSPRE